MQGAPDRKMRCGLLGEKLGHSYSPKIHSLLTDDYSYELFERSDAELQDFIREGDWDGLNVTIPYKKSVIPYCTRLSETASAIGSVNTLLRLPDGGLFGDNTDAFGFFRMLVETGTEPKGKKALVCGTGGASATVCHILRREGAEVITLSRRGEETYETAAERHRDAAILVNTTPLGMFPNNGSMAIDPALFPSLEAVLDVVYNPARTALLLRAEELGIPCRNGLSMLVAQAWRSAEIFQGSPLPDALIPAVTESLSRESGNLILIGMPGSGKTSIGSLLAEKLGRRFIDADQEIEKEAGKSIPEIFSQEGENDFRRLETETLSRLGRESGLVIATGGGCVKREENYPLLHQNGRIIRLLRDPEKLPREGRPLSLTGDLKKMAEEREPLYRRFADLTIDNNGSDPSLTVEQILEALT